MAAGFLPFLMDPDAAEQARNQDLNAWKEIAGYLAKACVRRNDGSKSSVRLPAGCALAGAYPTDYCWDVLTEILRFLNWDFLRRKRAAPIMARAVSE